MEEIVRDVVQFSEEEIGGLRGPGDDPEVAHRVEEEREDDGEAQTRERLKFTQAVELEPRMQNRNLLPFSICFHSTKARHALN